jgi:hypothetical protein
MDPREYEQIRKYAAEKEAAAAVAENEVAGEAAAA